MSLRGLISALGDSRPVIAPDTLGNGDSVAPPVEQPDIAWYAETSLRVMDALGIERVDLYGSHTGAHIAVEMAIAAPQRVARIVLDGIGMFSADEKRENLAQYAPAIEPDAFGGQFHWAWHFVRDQGWFFPYFKRDRAHLRGIDQPSVEALHTTTLEVLKSIRSYHKAYRAAFAHDDAARLPFVKQRTLVMADAADPLQGGVARAAALLADATSAIIPGEASAPGRADKVALLNRFFDYGLIDK